MMLTCPPPGNEGGKSQKWVHTSETDRPYAETIANALGYPVDTNPGLTPSPINDLCHLVIVGGQQANPVFSELVGQHVFRPVVESDTGVTIQQALWYPKKNPDRYGVWVWGVAGWTEEATALSANYIAQNGLPASSFQAQPTTSPLPPPQNPTPTPTPTTTTDPPQVLPPITNTTLGTSIGSLGVLALVGILLLKG